DHLGLQQARRCEPKSLREAPETAALDERGDADRHAAASLHVPLGSGRHSVIDVYPDRARPDGNGRSRRNRSRTAVGHKRIVQHDVVHRSCPDQERVRRTGGSVVAVPTAFDDKADVVLPREVDCSDHVSGLRRGHREGAGSRRPGVEPPRCLRQRRLIAQPVRILEPPERLEAGQALGRGPARRAAILMALAANLAIAVAKAGAAAITGSSAMLAEAIHSVADSVNEVLLLIGARRASRPPDLRHPFGHARYRFLYAFVVSLTVFWIGGVLSVLEGVNHLIA